MFLRSLSLSLSEGSVLTRTQICRMNTNEKVVFVVLFEFLMFVFGMYRTAVRYKQSKLEENIGTNGTSENIIEFVMFVNVCLCF